MVHCRDFPKLKEEDMTQKEIDIIMKRMDDNIKAIWKKVWEDIREFERLVRFELTSKGS